MNPETLFLHRCRQIEQLSATLDEHSLADCALYLHQILLDQHTLLSTVNKRRKIKIRFEARRIEKLPPHLPQPQIHGLYDALDPVVAPHSTPPAQRLGLDAFVATPILSIDNAPLTIRHVIGYVRNVDGGGHYDPRALTGEYAILRKLSRERLIQGLPAAFRHIPPIAWVTLRGLKPLIADIQARPEFQGEHT